VHITMPAPPVGHEAVSDAELRSAAGGCIMTDAFMCLFPTLPHAGQPLTK
jgi:hypothetical protein